MTGRGAGAESARRPAGLILTGGASRRMGRDKAAHPWAETTMLGAVCAALAPLCAELIIAAAADQRLPATPGVEPVVVRDPVPGQGPLRGLATGLAAAAARGHIAALTVATDMPLLSAAALEPLLGAADRAGPDAVVAARVGGVVQPLCAVYPVAIRVLAEELLAAGERSLRALLGRAELIAVDFTGAAAAPIRDFDTPAQVRDWRGRPTGG